MKVVSFNVNSIRARLHQLEQLIASHQPDLIGLQEIKVVDEEFPVEQIEAMGYQVFYHGQKGHYGVAMMSRVTPIRVQRGFAHDVAASQRRFIQCEFSLADGQILTVINGYFPQGENRSHPGKFPDKERFYADLLDHLQQNYKPSQPVLIMGDMNVAPGDIDIGIGDNNRKRWLKEGKCCFLPEERQWLESLTNWGLQDTFRIRNPAVSDLFSWFDYRSKGFDKDPRRGLRIDLILATDLLMERCQESGIDYQIRSMTRPSDHCPVWSRFDIEL
jgi:exodeoxyribonuclease-3